MNRIFVCLCLDCGITPEHGRVRWATERQCWACFLIECRAKWRRIAQRIVEAMP